jgi:hypothetical protein
MNAAERVTRELLGDAQGRVGVRVQPRRLSGVAIQPRRIGAPAQMVEGQFPDQQAVNYSPAQYTTGDVTYLGFGRFALPSTVGVLTPVTTGILRPSRPFVPQKLFCPSTQFGLYILQVLIEGTNLLASQNGIAIEMFSEASYFPQMEWPTIDPSTGIEFVVANPSAGALEFAPAFYGTDVRR